MPFVMYQEIIKWFFSYKNREGMMSQLHYIYNKLKYFFFKKKQI